MQFSERTSRISISPLTAIFQKAQELKARGVELLDFGAGESARGRAFQINQ